MILQWAIFATILLFIVESHVLLRDPVTFIKKYDNLIDQNLPYKWTEEYYDNMPIDHFSFADDRTFKLRLKNNFALQKIFKIELTI